MIKLYYLVLACIVAFSATQTCGDSTVKNIQSGLIQLGGASASFAQTTFVQTLKGNLGPNAQVLHAFAIAGFQGSCSPKFYALTVDTVTFENLNSRMRFTMDYEYDDGTNKSVSQWTKVKLTYLLVSDSFEGFSSVNGGQFLWAGSAAISVTGDAKVGLFPAGSVFEPQIDSPDSCGYLNKLPNSGNPSSPKFDINCVNPLNDVIIPHYYIMGFEFASGTYTLGAVARITDYLNQAGGGAGQNRAIFGNSAATQYGPIVEIMQLGGVKRLKVGFVLTTIRNLGSYPNQLQEFGYSGIYMPIQMENIDRPITQGTVGANQYNVQRFDLAKTTYQIYGFSSFSLAPSAKCVAIDVDVQVKDLFTVIVRTGNPDQLADIFVAGDFYSKNTLNLCSSSSATPARTMTEITKKQYTTVPDLRFDYQNIQQTTTGKNNIWTLSAKPQADGSTVISYVVELDYENFVAGNAYRFTYSLTPDAPNTFADALKFSPTPSIRFTVQINNKVVQDILLTDSATYTGKKAPLAAYTPQAFGIALNTTTPNVRFTITIPRPVDDNPAVAPVYDLNMLLALQIDEYTTIYNPVTDCCDKQCPAGSGINLKSTPPSCVVCKGDKNLAFNSNTGICSCATGYYNILSAATGNLVCFPCLGKLCSTCTASNITFCETCVVGASMNQTTKLCSCLSGFFEQGGACKTCPTKCTSCQVGGVCSACSDSNRLLNQNCQCAPGFYDDGSATCKKCNAICKTCSSATTCTSCFTENNRALVNGQCLCASGYFQLVNTNNVAECRKCSSQCKQCTSVNTCVDCDAASNRVSAYDENGRQTCLCQSGFTALKDGTCVENGCSADPYCQNCDSAKGIKVCIQCIASTNRVLAIPQYACLCKQGFYESNGVCRQCPSGCAKCSSANTCERCAVAATPGANGTCACPASYFFTTEPIRFCKRCNDYCLQCTSSNNCNLCLPGFSATTDGKCICPRGNYINAQLQCVPCINNCTVCSSEKVCTLCASGFYLQDGVCVKRCNVGYFISGVVCQKCQQGCQFCQRAGTCSVCQAGRFAFNGLCYINCPEGSIADTTNNTCLPCNAPCKTCVQHPSKCLSCSAGSFFEFACPANCPTGTYNDNGVCKYCSFECAACLNNPSTCIACPDGQFLFGGSCYAKCPVPLVGGKCPNSCPSGFFTASGSNNCVQCNSRCKTCQGSADRCTSCVSGVASNGNCITSCPTNTVNVNGNCVACATGCNGCNGSPDVCSACQSGFFLSGNKCLASCADNQFRDGNNGCKSCDPSCKTCSAANFCTSCTESRSQPINGVCYPCLYPCSNCTTFESCTACLPGFSLLNGRCTTACPAGSTSVNGVCRCTNGVLQNGNCVTNCQSGFTNINGVCTQCSSDCAQCSGNVTSCTACKQGFALNAVTGKCQVNRNCQFGEYFSTENNICTRICPSGYSYQDSVCVAGCLSGFKDNGFGGCVQIGAVSGCSFPYFFEQGQCVSTCNAGNFPNSATRICQACSSNCFSCMSSAFCTSCNSGFDLKNNICIAGARCAGNKLKYNGICVDSCPVGTLVSNGYCERRCDPDTYFLNGRCYLQCPAGFRLRTDVACVTQCQAGYILDGNVCKLTSQSCASGQFYNTQTSSCAKCSFPCAQCQFSATYCTACNAGSTLTSNQCNEANGCGAGRFRAPSGQCTQCPAKCGNCVSTTECSTCASGYVFNGNDCIVRVANLREVTMTQSAVSRRNNVVFVSVRLPIIPNGLSADQKNGFFIVIPSSNDKVVKVNQFVSSTEQNTVIVAVEYASYPTSISTLFLTINSELLTSSYINVGYAPSDNSFLSVIVSSSLPQAPSTLAIPSFATNSVQGTIALVTNEVVRAYAKNSVDHLD